MNYYIDLPGCSIMRLLGLQLSIDQVVKKLITCIELEVQSLLMVIAT